MESGQRILVVGATGNLGRPTCEAFARQGFQVRAMARDRKKLFAAFGDRFELAVGDATSLAAAEDAVRGCAGVHLCAADGPTEALVVETMVRAADRAGVRRLSYVSGTTTRPENAWFPLVAGKLRAERIVQAGKVPWTIFRPTWFMEVLLNFFQHAGQAGCFGPGRVRFHLLASDDFAAAVARAYATADAENRAFRVLGPEAIPLGEAIDRIRAALHPEIAKVTHLPYGVARVIAAFRGRAGRPMAEAVALLRYFERVEEGAAEPESERVLGRCPTTLDAWLAQRRPAA